MTIRNGNYPSADNAAPSRAMGRSVRQLGGDVLTLMELQAELLQIDLRDWAQSFVRPLAALAVAVVLALASVPVLLISLAYFLTETTELSMSAAALISAGAGLVAALATAGFAYSRLKRDRRLLDRFSSELGRNVRWLREVLTS